MTTSEPGGTHGRRDHAIVIGGSMAGLLAARALADHFAQVTVLDRDTFPDGPVPRKGVPQARHVHVLLLRGQAILERLFPGFQRDLAAAGATALDWIGDSATLNAGGWMPRFDSGLHTHVCSRDTLEWAVRQRLREYPQVTLRGGCEVVGLLGGGDTGDVGDTGAVRGVLVRARRSEEHTVGPPEPLAADLVVDASGRDSQAPAWLAALGYAKPDETVVNSFLGYASRWYRQPPEPVGDWKLLLVAAMPPRVVRGAVILPVDAERWLVTVSGGSHDYPPTDDAGFLAFARGLPTPLVAAALEAAEPLAPVAGYRRTENRIRHFERLPAWPDGFAAVGDAVCCFNPVYGQGMSVAAVGAETLGKLLGRQPGLPAGLTRRFQRRLARVNRLPWLMATGEDYRYPGVEGGRPGAVTRWLHRYLDGVQRRAARDPFTLATFIRVAHLTASPARLFHPRIAAGVAGQWLRERGTASGERRAPDPA